MTTRVYVCFASAFRSEAALCISHEAESTSSEKTFCGLKLENAATIEPDSNDLEPDCNTCRKISLRKRGQKPW